MELFIAIAILCQSQTTISGSTTTSGLDTPIECQQRYIHCVNTKGTLTKQDALERCIMERK